MRSGEEARLVEIARASPEAAQWTPNDYATLGPDGSARSGSAEMRILVAEVGNTAVGFIVVRAAAGEMEVLNLAVAPSARRMGVGSALMRTALAWGVERGYGEVFCEVRESNSTAQAFYAMHGFAAAGRRPNYYRAPDEDALVLARRR